MDSSVNQFEMSFILSPDMVGLEVCFIRKDLLTPVCLLITFTGLPFSILSTNIVSHIVNYILGGNKYTDTFQNQICWPVFYYEELEII